MYLVLKLGCEIIWCLESQDSSLLFLFSSTEFDACVWVLQELSKQELEDIKNAMKGYLKPGQTLTVEQKVTFSPA